VLDVATGAGHTAVAFASVAREVVAVDVTEPMLRVARDFGRSRGALNLRFVAGDVELLPFGEAAFDVVTCRIAPHHFASLAKAVREAARVLRPGGSFLVQDILGHDDADAARFITEVEQRRDPSHVRAYRAAEWKAFLRAAGLTIIDDAVMSKVRRWDDWVTRARMNPDARRSLEAFVRQAAPSSRDAFEFKISDAAIESFTDRMILLRADKD
jgi:ubiquinone/menaquinone biosynthesis C-methylase UbiE